MKFTKIPIYAVATAFMATPALVFADEPLDEAEIFFELNDTDGDLGIHGFADGEAWKELEIENPRGRELMEIDVKSRLKKQGVTELFFESAEPCFPPEEEGEEADCDNPLAPERFFRRFPEGTYEIEVETLEGDELESEVYLSHIIPAAPEVSVNGTEADDDCVASVGQPVMLSWNAVEYAHDEIGAHQDDALSDHGISVIYYEVVLEVDESGFKSTSIVPATVTSWTLPADFFANVPPDPEEGYKFEVLVRVDNGPIEENPGNKSAMEGCFTL